MMGFSRAMGDAGRRAEAPPPHLKQGSRTAQCRRPGFKSLFKISFVTKQDIF